MNRKQYSKETLRSIDKIQGEIATLKASLKTAISKKDQKNYTEQLAQELKQKEETLAILKQQKIKTKRREHGLAS